MTVTSAPESITAITGMPQMIKGTRIDTALMEILLMTIAELHPWEQGPTWSRASTATKHPWTGAESSFATETFGWSALLSEDSPFLSPWTYGRHLLLPSSSSYCCSYATIIPSFNKITARRTWDRCLMQIKAFRTVAPCGHLMTSWDQLSADSVGPP